MDYQFHSGGYDTGPGRLRARRPVTDYGSNMVDFMRYRKAKHRCQQMTEAERPSASYIVDMLPPIARLERPVDTIPAKQLHSSLNKIKHPVNVVKWTPEGRRLLTGSSSGEFTLWNGMGFNFETIMQAHDSAIRGAAWSKSGEFLISADQDGFVKYWQPNFNNVNILRAHDSALRGLAFSPTDVKFATASDDASLKIWDFKTATEEVVLNGHNWDVKAVDWHPTKGLLVSGSKDHQVKLWDPRSGNCLTTLHGHKNQITKTLFEPNRGQLLATAAQDQTARVFDLRMMRDVLLLRGHEKNIMTLTWHPVHSSLLSTGGGDGALFHYLLDEPNSPAGTTTSISPFDCPDPVNAPAQTIFPAHRIPYAHEYAIWSLDWHPLGHILASGSNDRVTRFWSRARPGDEDCFNDRYHIGEAAAEAHGTWSRKTSKQQARHDEEQEQEDEAEGIVDQTMPAHQAFTSGFPGMSLQSGNVGPAIPGMSAVAPSSLPPNEFPGIPAVSGHHVPDYSQLAKIFGGQIFPPGSLPLPPPPPPSFNVFQGSMQPQSVIPSNYHNAQTFHTGSQQDINVSSASTVNGSGTSVRKRGPLPSQQDTLREEMKRSKFLNGR